MASTRPVDGTCRARCMCISTLIIKREHNEKQKDKNDQLIIRYPNSKSYPVISDNLESKINNLKNKRQEFFNSIGLIPDAKWIVDQRAILNLPTTEVYDNINSPVSRAAHEFFGIDEIALQKYAGVMLTLAIEFGIIILSILGVSIRKINLDYNVKINQEVEEEKKPKRRLIPRQKSSLADSLGDKL